MKKIFLFLLLFLVIPKLTNAQALFSGDSLMLLNILPILPLFRSVEAKVDIPPDSPKYWLNLLKKDHVLYIVAKCESNLDYLRSGPEPNGHPDSLGLFQFQPNTWDKWTKEMNFEDADIWNPYDQLKVALWGKKHGGLRAWTCYRRIFQ